MIEMDATKGVHPMQHVKRAKTAVTALSSESASNDPASSSPQWLNYLESLCRIAMMCTALVDPQVVATCTA